MIFVIRITDNKKKNHNGIFITIKFPVSFHHANVIDTRNY